MTINEEDELYSGFGYSSEEIDLLSQMFCKEDIFEIVEKYPRKRKEEGLDK